MCHLPDLPPYLNFRWQPMDADRKRNRGPEEGGAKRPKLEDSPFSEHEISLHATYNDELLSNPITTDDNPEKGM